MNKKGRLFHIGITGSYGGLNLGDEAILHSIIAQLRKSLHVQITVFSRNAEDTRRRHKVDKAIPVRQITRDEVIPEINGVLSLFGDMTLWNILVSCVVLPHISPYSCMTNRMLWGHILSVVPETSSLEGGARFHLDTIHNRLDPLVT